MNKIELVNNISGKLNKTKKEVSIMVDEVFNEINNAFKNKEKVVISNFGTFKVVETKPFECFHPRTGEKMQVASQKRIRFSSSRCKNE